jgi:multidrug efflux system outer membrane protein
MKIIAAAAAACFLAGCATPHSEPLVSTLDLPPGAEVSDVSVTWWQLFGDQQLDSLVDEALSHNRDLQRAMSRIDESRAALKLARADYWPTVNGTLGGAREHPSANGVTPLPAGSPPTINDFQASLNVSYEVDLWGRVANANASARGELLATEYARSTLRNALIAQVVQSYATLQSIEARRRAYGDSVAAQRESLRLQRVRFDAGDIGELDIRQIEADLETSELQLPKLDRALGEAQRSLAVLLGRSPKDILAKPIARSTAAVSVTGELPAGIPSDLLLRRPDVRAAEARLRAAQARVDVARAAYFPQVVLTGSYGRESLQLSDLTNGSSLLWNLVASLTAPIWNGGRISAQNDIARAQRVQIELDYRDSVANAFREVADAIQAVDEAQKSVATTESRTSALVRAAELAKLRYEGGELSRLDVINADRAVLTSRADVAEERRSLAVAQSDLFRALGGGWSVTPRA